MSSLRRACLVAATTWLGLHLFLAAAYAADHGSLPVLVVATIVASVATAMAIRPLVPSSASVVPSSLETWGLAVAPAGTALLVAPFLGANGITGYANWPMGAMCVVIAALVFRQRQLTATISAVGLVAVDTWWVIAAGAAPVAALFLAVPPVLWLVAAISVNSVLRRSATAAEAYRRRSAESLSAMRLARAVTEAEQHRIAELEDAALPLLRAVANGATLDVSLVGQAQELSRILRDDLRARNLMTEDVRRAVSSARGRGIAVVLSADLTHGSEEPDHLVRQVLIPLLAQMPARSSISFRVTQEPLALTVTLAPADTSTVAYLQGLPLQPGWATRILDTVEGVVWFAVPPTGTDNRPPGAEG